MVNSVSGTSRPTTLRKVAAKSQTGTSNIAVPKQVDQPAHDPLVERRQSDDRRQQGEGKPLVELRSGRDRRRGSKSDKPSIDVQA